MRALPVIPITSRQSGFTTWQVFFCVCLRKYFRLCANDTTRFYRNCGLRPFDFFALYLASNLSGTGIAWSFRSKIGNAYNNINRAIFHCQLLNRGNHSKSRSIAPHFVTPHFHEKQNKKIDWPKNGAPVEWKQKSSGRKTPD